MPQINGKLLLAGLQRRRKKGFFVIKKNNSRHSGPLRSHNSPSKSHREEEEDLRDPARKKEKGGPNVCRKEGTEGWKDEGKSLGGGTSISVWNPVRRERTAAVAGGEYGFPASSLNGGEEPKGAFSYYIYQS